MHFDVILNRLQKSGKNVFTVYDISKLMGKSTPYASLMLSKSKKVKRIERGKYFLNDTSIYEIASNIIFPSYVSLQAGLQYYNLIDQAVVKYSVISLKRHKKILVSGNQIEFIFTVKKLFFGYLNKSGAYIASPEKAVIDSIYFGGIKFSTLKDAVETAINERNIDVKKLIGYAVKTESKVLASKLGFMLELLGIENEQLIPYKYYNYINISGTGMHGTNKKWMINYD